jgi:hypothetical protein
LHIWKLKPLQFGLSFLPTFHVLVLPSETDPEGSEFTVQLMTYHGKVILEDQIMIQSAGANKVRFISSLIIILKCLS